jgi:hypothetical protein
MMSAAFSAVSDTLPSGLPRLRGDRSDDTAASRPPPAAETTTPVMTGA